MNPHALAGLSCFLLLMGGMIPAPMARLSAAALSALLALAPIRRGKNGMRFLGMLLLLLSLWLAVDAYPGATAEQGRYREHARQLHTGQLQGASRIKKALIAQGLSDSDGLYRIMNWCVGRSRTVSATF